MIVLVNKKRLVGMISTLLIIILALVGIMNLKKVNEIAYPIKYNRYVEKYSKQCGIDKFLVYSIIKAESGFDEKAVSVKGAVGLMQIMPSTALEVATKNDIEGYTDEMLYEPETNIKIGCYYLAFLMDRYSGDIKTSAAAYNAGYGNVDKWLAESERNIISAEEIPFGETKKYIIKVETNYNKYREIYKEEQK